ncbi:MAG: hypothetical protein JRN56_07790 [Nitrososphaerota archaeon]|jgi:hypothetical protein|nr:hypothetical protein [Nitrososphaerota archaeon]MDG6912932.1 hypothetical protein [Nitrososphaerota archaeon]MDG6937225.1 hypothetical protein [Nitrososphaerota archaeon]MDG6961981.1 hypothetical protein [Nitrososphaerota archaeon]MDG6962766.1 hypothetical protein [Nitrososphaerota archaeon]
MNKNLIIVGGVLALIGLIVNVAVDRDNVYDMTTVALWALTVIFVFVGVFVGGKKAASSASAAPAAGR